MSAGKNIGNITEAINKTVIKGTPLQNSIKAIEEYLITYSRLDQNKSFENFIVGKSNNLAYQASQKVCEQIVK